MNKIKYIKTLIEIRLFFGIGIAIPKKFLRIQWRTKPKRVTEITMIEMNRWLVKYEGGYKIFNTEEILFLLD